MSQFEGVTFAQQHLAPADDANVRRAIFQDCALRGCGFAVSGQDLAMDAGYLMICGRQIRHPYPQTWTMTENSGYARLMLTIDMLWESGRELSREIFAAVDYAAEPAGFADPVQQDINNGAARYQSVLCIVSLSSSGISGFIEQIYSFEEVPA